MEPAKECEEERTIALKRSERDIEKERMRESERASERECARIKVRDKYRARECALSYIYYI